MDRLEHSGHVKVRKSFKGKIPHTDYRLTAPGRKALGDYWAAVDRIRGVRDSQER